MQETPYIHQNERILRLLRSIDKLEPFSDNDLQAFLKLGKLKKYEPNEIVIKEGDNDRWIYFLLTGEVEILKNNKPIKTLRRSGDIFGEMCLVDGMPRSATIQTTKDTLLLGVDGSVMERQKENLGFCYSLYRLFSEILAERLRLTTQDNIELQKKIQNHESEA